MKLTSGSETTASSSTAKQTTTRIVVVIGRPEPSCRGIAKPCAWAWSVCDATAT